MSDQLHNFMIHVDHDEPLKWGNLNGVPLYKCIKSEEDLKKYIDDTIETLKVGDPDWLREKIKFGTTKFVLFVLRPKEASFYTATNEDEIKGIKELIPDAYEACMMRKAFEYYGQSSGMSYCFKALDDVPEPKRVSEEALKRMKERGIDIYANNAKPRDSFFSGLYDFMARCVLAYDDGPSHIEVPAKMFDRICQECAVVHSNKISKISSFETYYYGRTVKVSAEKRIEG